jgi:hypothetical protein
MIDVEGADKSLVIPLNDSGSFTASSACSTTGSGTTISATPAATVQEEYEAITYAQWLCSFFRSDAAITDAVIRSVIDQTNTMVHAIRDAYGQESVRPDRDRQYGFVDGTPTNVTIDNGDVGNTNVVVQSDCDPSILNVGSGINTNSLVFAACALRPAYPYYPALYYLFPKATHDHDATEDTTTDQKQSIDPYARDAYITDLNSSVTFKPVEDGLTCALGVCTIGTRNDLVNGTESLATFVDYLDMEPAIDIVSGTVVPDTAGSDQMRLPLQVEGATAGATRANEIWVDTDNDGSAVFTSGGNLGDRDTGDNRWYPAFLDVGFFNGREHMVVRALSMDLDLLRRTTITGDSPHYGSTNAAADTDFWLPLPTITEPTRATSTGALIYGFREDAVREDGISRPTDPGLSTLPSCVGSSPVEATWDTIWRTYLDDSTTASTSQSSILTGTNFLMDAVSAPAPTATSYNLADFPHDPPVHPCNGISPKAVDFYPDPDRRSHGFLFRNGIDLRRFETGNSDFDSDGFDEDDRGFSFITDTALYIMGHFNVHDEHTSTLDSLGTLVEEFSGSSVLNATWTNFYDRTASDLNVGSTGKFANPKEDTWRITELMADSINLLSADFEFGSIAEGINGDNTNINNTSFATLGFANNDRQKWIRENHNPELHAAALEPAGSEDECPVAHMFIPTGNGSGAEDEAGDKNFINGAAATYRTYADTSTAPCMTVGVPFSREEFGMPFLITQFGFPVSWSDSRKSPFEFGRFGGSGGTCCEYFTFSDDNTTDLNSSAETRVSAIYYSGDYSLPSQPNLWGTQ